MYKLCFFIPETHLEQVKQALFKQGAGRIGLYECCSWQTLGEGQFKPMEGSQPFIGYLDQLEIVAEYKVEMVCEDELIASVVNTLISTHPYQEPAYEIYKIISNDELP